jgi:hypothetical protein
MELQRFPVFLYICITPVPLSAIRLRYLDPIDQGVFFYIGPCPVSVLAPITAAIVCLLRGAVVPLGGIEIGTAIKGPPS